MNRVCITGMGVVSPLGNTLEELASGLRTGRSGVSALELFDPASLPVRIAAQCSIGDTAYKDRKVSFAVLAAESAIADADSHCMSVMDFHASGHRGLSMGIGLELFDMHDLIEVAANGFSLPREHGLDPEFLQSSSERCVDELCRKHALRLPPAIHISACAAGADAIGHAMLRIRRGEATMMLAGGTDSMINPMGLGGFCKLNALSTRNSEPHLASRPFDISRDGFVLGEGAAVLVLEDMQSAIARGARVYAEVLGYGNSFDAYSVSDPHPEGRGAAQAMQRALSMAGLPPERIDYINAHGTSTPKNDVVETMAIKRVFGDHAYRIHISSTKSMIGHLISAAGAMEAVASTICAHHGFVHPTINLGSPDPACDLDYVVEGARAADVRHYLSNSFAFGGQNATLVMGRNV